MHTKQFAVDALSLTVPTSGWQIPGTVSSVHPPRYTSKRRAGKIITRPFAPACYRTRYE